MCRVCGLFFHNWKLSRGKGSDTGRVPGHSKAPLDARPDSKVLSATSRSSNSTTFPHSHCNAALAMASSCVAVGPRPWQDRHPSHPWSRASRAECVHDRLPFSAVPPGKAGAHVCQESLHRKSQSVLRVIAPAPQALVTSRHRVCHVLALASHYRCTGPCILGCNKTAYLRAPTCARLPSANCTKLTTPP